jgi:flagellar P-ring protein FlgI
MKTNILIATLISLCLTSNLAAQQKTVGDICRIKGQEQNELRGVGIVVGLNGTGDPEIPITPRALAEALSNSGMEVPKDVSGQAITEIYKNAKNVALVFVTATVPATGARQGSRVTCQVQSLGKASSLKGGTLLETSLTGGPGSRQTGQMPVLATASGRIHLEDPSHQTAGKIHSGAQLQQDFFHRFFEETTEVVPDSNSPTQTISIRARYLNLVVDKQFASFGITADIADRINTELNPGELNPAEKSKRVEFATAIDQINIRIRFPQEYFNSPVEFADEILNETFIHSSDKNAVVIVNSRTGTITVGDDVYFRPAAVSSGEFTIEAGMFRELALQPDQTVAQQPVKLQQLVQALNQIQAPPSTVIDVIRQLNAGGLLFGKLIEEY